MAVIDFNESYGQYEMELDDPRRTCFLCGDTIAEQLGIVWWGSATQAQDIFLHPGCAEHLAHHLIMDAYKLRLGEVSPTMDEETARYLAAKDKADEEGKKLCEMCMGRGELLFDADGKQIYGFGGEVIKRRQKCPNCGGGSI